jgi:hypothetical protein
VYVCAGICGSRSVWLKETLADAQQLTSQAQPGYLATSIKIGLRTGGDDGSDLPVLIPGPANDRVLLITDQLVVLEPLLGLVGEEKARRASSDMDDFQPSRRALRIVGNVICRVRCFVDERHRIFLCFYTDNLSLRQGVVYLCGLVKVPLSLLIR